MTRVLTFVPKETRTPRGGRPSIKWISAIVRLDKITPLTEALVRLNLVGGITLTDVQGFGRQRGVPQHYKGVTYTPRFLPKLKLDMVIASDDLPQVLELIAQQAQTGSVGDGKIFVHDVITALRIRTGEKGIDAL